MIFNLISLRGKAWHNINNACVCYHSAVLFLESWNLVAIDRTLGCVYLPESYSLTFHNITKLEKGEYVNFSSLVAPNDPRTCIWNDSICCCTGNKILIIGFSLHILAIRSHFWKGVSIFTNMDWNMKLHMGETPCCIVWGTVQSLCWIKFCRGMKTAAWAVKENILGCAKCSLLFLWMLPLWWKVTLQVQHTSL